MLKYTVLFALMLLVATVAVAAGYRFVTAETFKTWQDSGKKTIVIDIQVPAEFEKRHFKGAVETNAYPVKTDAEKERIARTLDTINASRDDIVIICPRGGGGAKNTYDYLVGRGVDEKRLFILEKGMEGWPYPEACMTGRERK